MEKQLQILLVEDSEDDELLMKRQLKAEELDIAYERVSDAESLKAALDKKSWDIVISDYILPGFSGLETLEIMNDKGLDIPCIIVSGKISDTTAVAAMKAGARDYITKDNLSRLGQAIQRELSEAGVRQDRSRIAKKLELSEEKYRRIVETANEGIVTVKPDGTIDFANAKFVQMTGETLPELMNKQILDFIDPEYLDFGMEKLRSISRGTTLSFEVKGHQKDGSIIWARINASPVYDAQGNHTGNIGLVTDITEEKQMERVVASERFAQTILDQAASAIVVCDTEGTIIRASSRAHELMGMDLQGQPFDRIFSRFQVVAAAGEKEPQRNYRRPLKFASFNRGELPQGNEIELITGSQAVQTFVINYRPLLDEGDFAGFSIALTDITARKQAENEIQRLVEDLKIHQAELEAQTEELRQAHQEAQEASNKYLDLYDHAPVGYLTVQPDSTILEFNTTATRMLGLNKAELINATLTKFISPDCHDALYFCLHQALNSKRHENCEIRMVRRDGSEFAVKMDTLAVRNTMANSHQVRIAISDITELKQAEAALMQAKDELETKVKERTAALSRANEQLKSYSHRITQVQEEERKRIAYELHDDTAQYLAILKLQLDSLIHSGKIESPEVLTKLQLLEKDAGRAVDDVRRYSHELRPTILEHLGLQAALEQIAEDINKLNLVKVEVNVEGSEPDLSEDIKLGFFRIAQEALNNSRKHARADNAVIDLKFMNDRMEMTVSDNGVGFDPQEAIGRSVKKGSLGLMSMQERAKIIGATISIESQPGKGTTVTAKMPMEV